MSSFFSRELQLITVSLLITVLSLNVDSATPTCSKLFNFGSPLPFSNVQNVTSTPPPFVTCTQHHSQKQ